MKIFILNQKSEYEKGGELALYVVAEDLQDAKVKTSHVSADNLIALTELSQQKITTNIGFHSTVTEEVLYRDLIPGDLVFEQGHLFKLNAVWSYLYDTDYSGRLAPNRIKEVVRCDDEYVKDYHTNKNLPGWAKYGVVGAAGKETACIVKRCVNPFINN